MAKSNTMHCGVPAPNTIHAKRLRDAKKHNSFIDSAEKLHNMLYIVTAEKSLARAQIRTKNVGFLPNMYARVFFTSSPDPYETLCPYGVKTLDKNHKKDQCLHL